MSVAIIFTGNIVEDPELRYTPAGNAVINFRVACNDRVLDSTTNTWKDQPPVFQNVTAWRQLAENIAESVRKGDQVVVVGETRQREYETREGEKRTAYEVQASSVGVSLAYASATPVRNPRPGAQV